MSPPATIDPRVREATASLHPLGLDALLRRFGHLPVKVSDNDEPFPQALRLIISSHCDQRCQYPDEGVLWCHNEGIARDALKAPQAGALLETARFFRDRYGIRRVKIGGLEPLLGRRLFDLIRGLREMGIDDVSFTTHGRGVNGRLRELKEAGLTRLTVSIQNFDRDDYQRLTDRDGLADALALVEEAAAVGLVPLKINRVLLRRFTDDLPAFLAWLRAGNLTARLFDLMWQPGHDDYYLKYLVSWQDFLPLWEGQTERLEVRRYRTSWRTRMLFRLRGGGAVEANLLEPKWHSAAPVCRACPLAEVCAEGYLGCGVRITPDLRLSPCILRDDLSADLHPLPAADAGAARDLDALLGGAPPRCRQPLPLLAEADGRTGKEEPCT
jgi:molybdenum cofactor biosynthesis enzyme MoaA